VPAYAALSIRKFLANQPIPSLPQPPYSLDLFPPKFFKFPKPKITLNGRRYQRVEDIITNAMNDLKAIPQTSSELPLLLLIVEEGGERGALLFKEIILKFEFQAKKDIIFRQISGTF
jgi:hypothetical protein